MTKEKVIIVGASGHSKVIIDIFEKQGKYEIIGLVDNNPEIEETLLGYNVLGNDSILPQLMSKHSNCKLFLAIGDNWIRNKAKQNIYKNLPAVEFATAIHPSAQIAKGVEIGQGTAIMAGAIINSSSKVGTFCIINTKASMDHDNVLSDFASLGPNVTNGGNVTIGEFSAIGISATIKHGITIGSDCVIGGGSLVLKNCENNNLIYGVPAKEIRTRNRGDKYL